MQTSATEVPGENSTSEGLVEAASEFQQVLEGLAAAEGRFVASGLLVVALVLGIVVFPALAGRARSFARRLVQNSRFASGTERASAYVPTSFAELLLRVSQLTVALAVVAAFLVVWGFLDLSAVLSGLIDLTGPRLYDAMVTLLFVAAAFVASDQLQRFIDGLYRQVDGMTEHQEEILLRVGQVAIFVTAGASILAVWRVDISGLLIGAGFLGIVVGFAARKTLGSLIAGFVLMFSRPFTIGDWVEIGENHGVVTDITIFNTRLENFDGEFVIIPNDQVSERSITNRSRKGLLRLKTDVSIDYGTDVETAKAVAFEAMEEAENVVTSPHPQVVPKAFDDSAIVLELRYWIDHPSPPRKWRAVDDVVTGVKETFDEEGIVIPFPQRTVSGREGDTPSPGRDNPADASVDGETENGQTAQSPIRDRDA